MAASDLVQKGTAVHVGFGGNTHTNLIMQTASEETGRASKRTILSEQGAAATHIIVDPQRGLRLTGVLKGSALATVRALKMGDAVTVTQTRTAGSVATAYFIAAPVDIEMAHDEARVTIALTKQEAWTHS
jgi:hypothetical protein